MKIGFFVQTQASAVTETALRELKAHLSALEDVCVVCSESEADVSFFLRTDAQLPKGAWRVQGAPKSVVLSGVDDSALMCSVMECMEMLGTMFTVNGPLYATKPNWKRVLSADVTVTPVVQTRGIRQHINFPMDISSYSQKDACAYIQNVARMKYNSIIFHSYQEQWVCYNYKGDFAYAGQFFYGQQHPVIDEAGIASSIENSRYFCIPEIESVFEDKRERSKRATEWLLAVMAEAKAYGLSVIFSVEPPRIDDISEAARICVQTVETYAPYVDVLQLITPESGGGMTGDSTVALETITNWFGDIGLSEEKFNNNEEMIGILYNLHLNLMICEELLKVHSEKTPHLSLGVYTTEPEVAHAALEILRRFAPKEVGWSFLPGHGAAETAKTFDALGFSPEEWKKTQSISWIEFDGNMYVSQNNVRGIEQMITTAEKISEANETALYFNHWKNSENLFSIWFAARRMVSPMPIKEAYSTFARFFGIADDIGFASAMELLDDLGQYCRSNLFNIGFCVLGCWLNPKGLGWLRMHHHTTEKIQDAIGLGKRAANTFAKVLNSCGNSVAREFIRLMENRARCSVIHFEGVGHLVNLLPLCEDDHPEKVTDRCAFTGELEAAKRLFKEYLLLHKECLPDRGSQGNLLSYALTLPVYVDHVYEYFINGETQCVHRPYMISPPPPPALK